MNRRLGIERVRRAGRMVSAIPRAASCVGLLIAAAALSPAAAQQAPADEAEPVDELEALSRAPGDSFAAGEAEQARAPVSVTVRALDKITARFTDIEIPIETVAKFGSLEILPRYCDKRPPEEFPETTAFLEVFDRGRSRARASQAESDGAETETARAPSAAAPAKEENVAINDPRTDETGAPALRDGEAGPLSPEATAADPDRIFSGWMFASSPGLNALEHPVYDVWVIDCETVAAESRDEPAR
ncbi:DUF2155 domain-containing protein [Amphiplicatus metriothermophilus]|uniref:DUF2155 domain-containing protein n=1 Tax=Amphiplicatus metriothermophilus TaxID=1519374 RepID=A0A239PV56_9PROT|nr:DUF2155 domain-containing protein [Amphiplicatus metriothermophilus]MBB5519617.1 hypothetical protein [Amphiplicatus metriothermophilus]SNT74181.1 hypothetical protein SAMN06297382_2089 [Amphiplicatus metriothermophilus]